MYLTKESSPFRESSSFANSPRLFWKEQTVSPKSRFEINENENEGSSVILSPKRNSIENLKKQSRVKNSSIFALEQQNEYDPSSILSLDRPLAAGRPLNTAVQGNAFAGQGMTGLRKETQDFKCHRRAESQSKIPTLSPTKSSPTKLALNSPFTSPVKSNASPTEARASPTKSSLASHGRFNSPHYNADSSVMSDDEELKHQTPRPLRRHAKSVTFDTAPPTITEYDLVTPDPSAASGSREGSYDSEEDEEDMSFDVDDSFDASLEDTDKTPVVLPEDWRHMSPEAANTSLTDVYDDVFDGRDNSPMPTANPNIGINGPRLGSVGSDADARPLPPLPALQAHDGRRRRNSSIGVSAAAERASDARRSLPQPPKAAGISKADLLSMRETSMSLEDRLRLMNFDDERDTCTPTQESHDMQVVVESIQVHVDEVEVSESEIALDEPKAPRISRESILRRVKSRNFNDYDDDYEFDSEFAHDPSYGDLADLDPDVPIPSRECSSNFDENPCQPSNLGEIEGESALEACSFAEVTEVDGTEISQLEDYERETSVIRHPIRHQSDDDSSQYSTQPEEQPTSQSTIDTSGPPTPTALNSSPAGAEKQMYHDAMFSSFEDRKSMDLSLDPLKASMAMAPSPMDTVPKMDAMREFLRRPVTPEGDTEELESDDPGTPDSVIRHPIIISPPEEASSPEIPQQEASIRGAGGLLKTRPSLIPDEVDMAATRRQVSGEHAPPVPERSPKRQSLVLELGHVDEDDTQISISNKENSILQLDFCDESNELSFGLDREFNHIIEAQKVRNLFPLPSFAKFPVPAAAVLQPLSFPLDLDLVATNKSANACLHQQKGYLMRENSKVVVASSRQFSDEKAPVAEADNETSTKDCPRKSSAERKPAWTKEPWNSKTRRKSIRTSSGRCVPSLSGPAPPLPGQESAVSAGLDSVAEQQGDEQFEEGEERGRVFVKVVGVKDLDLPLPTGMCFPL